MKSVRCLQMFGNKSIIGRDINTQVISKWALCATRALYVNLLHQDLPMLHELHTLLLHFCWQWFRRTTDWINLTPNSYIYSPSKFVNVSFKSKCIPKTHNRVAHIWKLVSYAQSFSTSTSWHFTMTSLALSHQSSPNCHPLLIHNRVSSVFCLVLMNWYERNGRRVSWH